MASLVWGVGSRVRCVRGAPGSDVLGMGVQELAVMGPCERNGGQAERSQV